jgi:SAM-dependent methyltransferase
LVEDAWDVNAPRRHQQIISGVDLTFSKVTTPAIIDILISQPGHEAYSVLDVGCGTGVLTRILSEHVKHVTGIDPSAESVRIAHEHTAGVPNISLEAVAIEDFVTEEQASYDFVVAHMVLNSIRYLDKALSRIYSLLRDNGLFVFSIPHPCFFAERKRGRFRNYTYFEPSYNEVSFTISGDPEPLPRKTPYYHRPMSFYDRALRLAGFAHEEMIEPQPDEETCALYPSSTSWDYAHILIIVCRKRKDSQQGGEM